MSSDTWDTKQRGISHTQLKILLRVASQSWRWLLRSLSMEQFSYLSILCRQVFPTSNRKTRLNAITVLFCCITLKLRFWFSSLLIPMVALPALTFYDCDYQVITSNCNILFFFKRKINEINSYFGGKSLAS